MMNKLQRPSAEDYDDFKYEDRDPVKAASRHRVEEANRKRNEEKEEAALSVDVTKFERAAWLLTAACLVIVAVSVHLLTRFHYGFKWIAMSLLAVAPLYLWLSSNIRESFLAEVRERKADAIKDPKAPKSGDPTILDSESAEWMNAVIAKLWPIINTDLALPMLDIVEDALKDKYPKLIDTVRIEELDLGVTPFRIVKMKYLDPESRISERHDVESDSSRFVNMEVDFEYRGENRKVASDNLHMLIYMGLGPSKLATIEIPTFAELSHASGTMRIRMELISDPPFAETATVSFPQMPDFTLSARPLKSVDVMRFPLMTSYVKKAVGDVISRFIAPDAFSLNVARLIMGQDVDLTTQAQGLMVVVLHSAYGLSNTDRGSKSDPFVIISWSKLGKTLYTSRVIRNELHPQWEEAVFIPVPPDALRDGDRLCITVWDSDRFTADDSLGKAELDINDMFDNAGTMQTFDEPLSGAIRKGNNRGNVKFSAGYFKKADVSAGSTKAPAGTVVSMRVGDAGAPLEADSPKNERAQHYSSRIMDTMDAKIPPSPKQSSGILAIQLHQMDELDIQQKNAVPGLGDSKVETNTPSTYAQIFVNDDLIFTTRLKRLSSSPYINARTEIFCKDWTRTRVDVVILDYRERENDAVLGVISLRLADILANTSQVSSWRPLLGGIGTGRCRLSILFKPIHIYLPPTLKGWNVGTMLIDKIKGHNIPAKFKGKIVVNMAGTKIKTSTTVQSLEDSDGQGIVTWRCQPPLRIPMLRRYQRALSFRLVDTSHNLGAGKTLGEGILWMSNVVDDTASEPEIRLYSGDDVKRRRYNHDNSLAEGISADTPEDSGRHISDIRRTRSAVQSSEGVKVHQEGLCLQVSLRFSRGLSSLHSTLLGDVAPASLQDSLRMREHAIQAGERKAGSARFNHRDAAQKADRERNLAQARDAASDNKKEHESAISSSNAGQMNLGSIPAAEGGGLAEIPRSALNDADGQGEAGNQDELIDEEEWEEEDAAEDAEKDASNNKGLFAEKREDFRSDRMHERGVFQSKIGRTAKWLKDSSRRKGHDLRNKFGHTDDLPMAPETENISHLT